MPRHKGKVDDLTGDPKSPERFAAVPDLIAPFVVGMLQRMGLLLNYALDRIERWEVYEGVAAAHNKDVFCFASTIKCVSMCNTLPVFLIRYACYTSHDSAVALTKQLFVARPHSCSASLFTQLHVEISGYS